MRRLLILGGTSEARHLAEMTCSFVKTTSSLAGETRDPATLAGTVRIGGFGGADGLISWVQNNHIDALIDATHPFARNMPWHAHQACKRLGLPRLRLLRPRFCDAGSVHRVKTLQQAIDSTPAGKRLLVTTGKRDTDVLRARPDLTVHLRSIEPVPDLPANVLPLLMRPPFTQEDECALMRKLQIDVLIAKDAGGVTAPKLAAARVLGIDVILLDRPEQPPGPLVQTAEQAVAWLQHVVGIEN